MSSLSLRMSMSFFFRRRFDISDLRRSIIASKSETMSPLKCQNKSDCRSVHKRRRIYLCTATNEHSSDCFVGLYICNKAAGQTASSLSVVKPHPFCDPAPSVTPSSESSSDSSGSTAPSAAAGASFAPSSSSETIAETSYSSYIWSKVH